MQHNTQLSVPLLKNWELESCAYLIPNIYGILGKDTNVDLWNHILNYSKAIIQDSKRLR